MAIIFSCYCNVFLFGKKEEEPCFAEPFFFAVCCKSVIPFVGGGDTACTIFYNLSPVPEDETLVILVVVSDFCLLSLTVSG